MTLADISESTKVPYATVHREARRLIDAGIFNENKIGNAVVVEFNPDSPMTLPLRQLIETALGPVPILKDLLSRIDGIAAVYIFGSWAARTSGISGPPPSDIDVIIIGNPEVGEIYKACRSAGLRLRQTVNPILMGENEWREPSAFNESIKSRPLVTVIDELIGSR